MTGDFEFFTPSNNIDLNLSLGDLLDLLVAVMEKDVVDDGCNNHDDNEGNAKYMVATQNISDAENVLKNIKWTGHSVEHVREKARDFHFMLVFTINSLSFYYTFLTQSVFYVSFC